MIISITKKAALIMLLLAASFSVRAQEIFKKPAPGTQTRWVSPENPTGGKGQGGKINKGAKGNAYFVIMPGEKKIIFDVKGAGIVNRIWMSGTVAVNPEQRRSVKLDMFWDNAVKPAVSAPIGDFFGAGLGLLSPFENSFFASPEGRSFNSHVPMPYRTAARMEITNESPSVVLLWYDINYLVLPQPDKDAMYFHAYWSRDSKTTLGKDFEILPKLNGAGRYLGSNIGVIGNPAYYGTWFGEGEVKVFLDGDKPNAPTLVGTGTEDYIGTGWGQGVFNGPYHGSLMSDPKNDIYTFYRYHTVDPIYFYKDCRVTIHQMGSALLPKILEWQKNNVNMKPADILDIKGAPDVTNIQGKTPVHTRLLDEPNPVDLNSKDISLGAFINYLRADDDVSATAYFYLDKPESNLPALPGVEMRMKDLKTNVFDKQEANRNAH